MGNETSHLSEEDLTNLREQIEPNCRLAANLIDCADVLLVTTGAGFSADSGLLVFNQIADVEPYRSMGIEYCDLASPEMLEKDPKLFYGFVGHTLNTYRDTKPHLGYQLLLQWRDQMITKSPQFHKHFEELVLAKITQEERANMSKEYQNKPLPDGTLPKHIPCGFFMYTSNIDSHAIRAGFHPEEIHEIHGSLEKWQCAHPSHCSSRKEETDVWFVPERFRFVVDETSRLAQSLPSQFDDRLPEKSPSELGFLRLFPTKDPKEEFTKEQWDLAFENNLPSCPNCGYSARPNVLFFCDMDYQNNRSSWINSNAWHSAVDELFRDQESPPRVVVLEIGAGMTVPSIRMHSERCMERWKCTLIRINPALPNPPVLTEEQIASGCNVVPIMTTGLHALQLIDQYLTGTNEHQ